MEIRRLFLGVIFILCFPVLLSGADLTPGEKRRIGSAAEDTLREVVDHWKAGRYEEIYGYGYLTTQVSLSKESFVRQMKSKLPRPYRRGIQKTFQALCVTLNSFQGLLLRDSEPSSE